MNPRMETPRRVKETRSEIKHRAGGVKSLLWFLGLFLGEKRREVNGEAESK